MHYSRRSPACLATLCILPSPTQKKALCALEIQAAILIGLIPHAFKIVLSLQRSNLMRKGFLMVTLLFYTKFKAFLVVQLFNFF